MKVWGSSRESISLMVLLLQRDENYLLRYCHWFARFIVTNVLLDRLSDPAIIDRLISTMQAIFSVVSSTTNTLGASNAYTGMKKEICSTAGGNPLILSLLRSHPVLGITNNNNSDKSMPSFPADEDMDPMVANILKLFQSWTIYTANSCNRFDLSSATNQHKRTTHLFTIVFPVEVEYKFPRPALTITAVSTGSEKESITNSTSLLSPVSLTNPWLQRAQENLFSLFLSGADLSEQVDSEKHLPQLQARKAKLTEHLLLHLEFIPPLVHLVLNYP